MSYEISDCDVLQGYLLQVNRRRRIALEFSNRRGNYLFFHFSISVILVTNFSTVRLFPTYSSSSLQSNCTKIGGYLADLNSRAIYDIVYNYIDETYSTVIQAWTGMRYEVGDCVSTDHAVVL